jgi:hypothetical protein
MEGSAPPSDMVDGPCKRRPTERVTENGDPLVQKKAKTASTNTKITSSTTAQTKGTAGATTLSCHASIEDVVDPAPAPGSQPRHPGRILEAADGADDHDGTFGMPNLIDIEDSDDDDNDDNEDSEPEDDDAELGMVSSYIC